MHPYKNLSPKKFWKTGAFDRKFEALEDLVSPKFTLRKNTSIATYGSCFAQNIGKYLVKKILIGSIPSSIHQALLMMKIFLNMDIKYFHRGQVISIPHHYFSSGLAGVLEKVKCQVNIGRMIMG